MTTEISKTAPPPVPPRHSKEYYEDNSNNVENTSLASPELKKVPITPKRISSRISPKDKHDLSNTLMSSEMTLTDINIERNASSSTLSESKEINSNIENEIMKDLNQLSNNFKLSEDKLTLYELEKDDEKKEESDKTSENKIEENELTQSMASLTTKDDETKSNSDAVITTREVPPTLSEKEEVSTKEHSEKKKKSSKSKKSKDEKKKSKEEKKKSKRKSALLGSDKKEKNKKDNEEIQTLKEREKTQREFIIKEQEKLAELNQKQYLLLQHQYTLAVNQKKQYNILVQNNNLEQLAILQQQHERENASLQQNQNALVQQVIAQQQTITDAVDIHNNVVKKLIEKTGESAENYAIPTPPAPQDNMTAAATPSSPHLMNTSQLNIPSPAMSPALSPIVNNSYYDEGVYSVSGFSIASNNTSMSEDVESVSILTDQLQQSININRRPTFQKPANLANQRRVRIGGSDPSTFQTTLDAYRQNVKNASDPALQFEYAKFLIEAANDQYENGSSASNQKSKNDLFDEGYKFLKKLSHAGYPDAQHYLATCYKQDDDWDKAYPLFLQAAKHNHPISSYEIASYYESKRNYKKASQYYKKSASQGYPMAMHRLGVAALKGEMHMRKDVKNATKWLKRAATVANRENNGAASAYELSLLYEKGMPPAIYPDELYSLELLVQAAELDYPPAQYKLGWCFEYGELGCPTDAVQSIHWFLLAAENDEPNAQFALAGWYLTGAEGVIDPNDQEAFHWASKAANQQYVKAEYAVAYFYEMGIGIEKNMEEAMNWYKIAAEHGDQRAIKRLENESESFNEKSSNDCKIS